MFVHMFRHAIPIILAALFILLAIHKSDEEGHFTGKSYVYFAIGMVFVLLGLAWFGYHLFLLYLRLTQS